jgi:hypothetical protein
MMKKYNLSPEQIRDLAGGWLASIIIATGLWHTIKLALCRRAIMEDLSVKAIRWLYDFKQLGSLSLITELAGVASHSGSETETTKNMPKVAEQITERLRKWRTLNNMRTVGKQLNPIFELQRTVIGKIPKLLDKVRLLASSREKTEACQLKKNALEMENLANITLDAYENLDAVFKKMERVF